MFPRLAINIIRKDWFEYRKTIFYITAGMLVPILLTGGRTDFARGAMMGVLVGASYGYAFYCFGVERVRGTLDLLLGLPVDSFDLVIAKYASLYSMALFTANIPGVFLADLHALFVLNSIILFLGTCCMAVTVVVDKPWAPMIPVYFVFIFFMPVQTILKRFYPDGMTTYSLVASHITEIASLALISTPVIALLSALYFRRSSASA